MTEIPAITDRTAWQLARLAGCADPDTPTSPGAVFLYGVQQDVIERVEEGSWSEDAAHEIADGAVPVYTHNRWLTFVDLAAYDIDPSELGEYGDDMTGGAGACLYIIAERLASAVADELKTEDEDDDQ